MGKLIYLMTTSLDGYAADKNGNIDWTAPSDEEHAFINNVLQGVGTFLLGRRMCETLAVWDTMQFAGESKVMGEFAKIWQAADKVMYSRGRSEAFMQNCTVEHQFDAEKIRTMKAHSGRDLDIGGPHLASEAIRAGLIDEYHQIIAPTVIGSGIRWLPNDVQLELDLVDVQRFKNGFVHLEYKPA